MHESDDIVERLAGGLADELAIDWSKLKPGEWSGQETLENLEILNQIA